ncbi:MAG TPA: TolC family protein [Gemmatimonadaceae bacterium]|nr:TolC family protein [Gemmatimonadaceae bacterium]
MKVFRLAAVAAFAAAPSFLAAQVASDSAHPITLDEAVRLAQRNSPLTVQARGQMRLGGAGVRAAYASFIPRVDVGLSAGHQGGDRIGPSGNIIPYTGRPWSYGSNWQASVDLFDGGQRFFNLRQQQKTVDAADANETAQRFTVSLNVKQQYYNVLAARESEAAARAQLQQAAQQLRASSARVAAGAATKSDSLRSVIQVGNARLALVTAQNNLNFANAQLTRMVATPFVVTAFASDTMDRPTISLDSAALQQYAERGPAVRQAEANLSAAKAAVRASKTPYLPTITASYFRSGNGFDKYFGRGAATYVCGQTQPTRTQLAQDIECATYVYSDRLSIQLNYPLFNQWTREFQLTRDQVAEDNAEASLRDARLLAQQTLTQQIGALRNAEERISIQEASVAAAEEDLRVQQQRYNLGASTLLDVLTSQTQLNQAQAALIQARYDYRVATAQLEALVGRDLTMTVPR